MRCANCGNEDENILAVLIEREPLMEKRTWLNALIVMR